MSRNNFFAALNDDSEDEDAVVKKQQAEAQNKSKKQNNKKKDEAPAAKNASANSKPRKEKEKETQATSKSMEDVNIIEPSKEQPHSGGGSGRRGGRGSGFVGGRDRRGKREYDRHSGQRAARDVERKGGGGGHNWGKAGEDEEQAAAEVLRDEKAEEAEADAEVNEQEQEEEIPEEPEVAEKTLEEYEAERAAKRQGEAFKPIQTVQVEKINDGTEYRKDTAAEEGLFGGGAKAQRRVRDRKKEKNIVETAFTVKDDSYEDRESSFRGRGRGGRGRGRGRGGDGRGRGRGRGGPRSYRSNQRVDPTSSLDFPALGAS